MEDFTTITCDHAGTPLEGFVAMAGGSGPMPAVILFPGATGWGPSFRQAARELAALGYLAVGADMYARGSDMSTPEAAGKHFMELLEAPEKLRERVNVWHRAVASRPDVDASRIVAIGYCFGGKCVLELARSGAELKAVVSFHGLLGTDKPARAGAVKAEVVAWCAGQDPYVPMADVETFQREMAAAEASHQVTIFSYASHSFMDPDHDGLQPGIAYHPLAHRIAWDGTLALLEQLQK